MASVRKQIVNAFGPWVSMGYFAAQDLKQCRVPDPINKTQSILEATFELTDDETLPIRRARCFACTTLDRCDWVQSEHDEAWHHVQGLRLDARRVDRRECQHLYGALLAVSMDRAQGGRRGALF